MYILVYYFNTKVVVRLVHDVVSITDTILLVSLYVLNIFGVKVGNICVAYRPHSSDRFYDAEETCAIPRRIIFQT